MTELSEAHSLEIGQLAVLVSRLDSLMTDLIAAFSDTHIVNAMIMVHHQQFSSKVDTLRALIRMSLSGMEEMEIDQIIAPILEAKTISDYRNTVLHCIWKLDANGTPIAVKFSARGEFRKTSTPVSLEEIRGHVAKARALIPHLVEMRDHFQRSPPQGGRE